MRRNGFAEDRNPILKPLGNIECRDAILAPDGTEPDWPEADVMISNPPFLGGHLLISNLGEDYVSRMFATYINRVPATADLVCYWFEKAGQQIASGKAKRAGLVATNSIRGGANRRVLQAATDNRRIFEAWSDEPWIVDGAAVRVSLVCFSRTDDESVAGIQLNGAAADEIYSDLTARRDNSGIDLTNAQRLAMNAHVSYKGDEKGGPFNVPGDLARKWLQLPANPNGRTNADVLKPWMNGMDLTRRPQGKWVIDFGLNMSEGDAALFEEPYQWIKEHVWPMRQQNRREAYREYWWKHAEPRPAMRAALNGLARYIVTPRVAKHRLFVWLDASVCPDSGTIAIARDDDITFGILHSRFHEAWSLRLGTWLGKGNDPRYTSTTTFETFPFPEGLTPDIPAADYADDPRAVAIAEAARRLVELRDNWLNPPEWVEWVDEPVPGYPKRPVPRSGVEKELKERTLTNLYNKRPPWLANAHEELNDAVAAAYGWSPDISDDDVLQKLLALNIARSGGIGRLMNITGSHTVPASRERVWELLHDPDALQRMVPGCQTLDAETPQKFSATLSVGVGPIRGRFSGSVEIEDVAVPESYKMTLSGQGPTGFVSGEGMINLTEDGDGTLVEVEADAQVGGTLAQIGSRMIQTAVRMLMGQFFDALAREAAASQ